MAEILLSKNPLISQLRTKSVQDYFATMVDKATDFNIATGFITNDSIATLQQIVDFKRSIRVNLFIGMNYLEGFTKIQYQSVCALNDSLTSNNQGNVFLSPNALYHGKMYSFLQNDECLGGYIGSSNLGSFVGKDPMYVEADAFFDGAEGNIINQRIISIIDVLGKKLSILETPTTFREPDIKLLKDYHFVEEVQNSEMASIISTKNGFRAEVALKTEEKSNLNSYFGKGKIKGKYSPRGWYEVELIISKKTPAMDVLPKDYPFTVVTNDGYRFKCERQGDYSKNLRSCFDLKILGRWIKGKMENEGALQIGKPVTDEVLSKFGHNKILFEQTNSIDEEGRNIWLISLV